MTSERMFEADQTALLLSFKREMVELKRRNKEVSKKNEQEIEALRMENEDMKELVEGGPSIAPTNLVGKSITSPPNPKAVKETKDRDPTQEIDGESCPNNRHSGFCALTPVHRFHHWGPTVGQVEGIQEGPLRRHNRPR